MTDNEIIKALEYCRQQGITSECERCKIKSGCRATLVENALDLIKRQEAEIERLKEYEDIRPTGCPNCHKGNFSNSKFCCHCGKQLQGKKKDVKSEAIREFAEKLKERTFECDVSQGYGRPCYEDVVTVIEIDNLVAEMMESEEQ